MNPLDPLRQNPSIRRLSAGDATERLEGWLTVPNNISLISVLGTLPINLR